jgi:DNA-binding NtrC family response regulator
VNLVFSDVVMAGSMSGFDLAVAIQERRPGLKVLLTTG